MAKNKYLIFMIMILVALSMSCKNEFLYEGLTIIPAEWRTDDPTHDFLMSEVGISRADWDAIKEAAGGGFQAWAYYNNPYIAVIGKWQDRTEAQAQDVINEVAGIMGVSPAPTLPGTADANNMKIANIPTSGSPRAQVQLATGVAPFGLEFVPANTLIVRIYK